MHVYKVKDGDEGVVGDGSDDDNDTAPSLRRLRHREL